MTLTERLAWSVTWGLTATSTLGILFQGGYCLFTGKPRLWPPFYNNVGKEIPWEAPSLYYFCVWLILSGVALLYFFFFRRQPSLTAVTEVAQGSPSTSGEF